MMVFQLRIFPDCVALFAFLLVVAGGKYVVGNDWVTKAKITPSDGVEEDQFGFSVAISGGIAAIGAPAADTREDGSAYVYHQLDDSGSVWSEMAILKASDSPKEEQFGRSVAVFEETVVVGAVGSSDYPISSSGAAYIFELNEGGPNNWGEAAKLTASDGSRGDRFGQSTAMFDNTVIVGAYYDGDDGYQSGSAYVFDRNEGGENNWGEVMKLTASDGASDDRFGRSVSISNDTLIVGAYLSASPGLREFPAIRRGAAYIFERNKSEANDWSQLTKLTAVDPGDGERDWFGFSVSVSGDTAIAGAPLSNTNQFQAGAAYIFGRNQGGNDSWGQLTKLIPDDAEADDRFGYSVSIYGETAIVGARFDDDRSGSAYIFERNQGGLDNWGQVAKLTAFDAIASQLLGSTVAIAGESAIVGAPDFYPYKNSAGSAYLFGTASTAAINGGGQTLLEDFDSMSTRTKYALPNGWSATVSDGENNLVHSLGLIDGSLETSPGPLSLGGNTDRFSLSPNRIPVWSSDVNGDDSINDLDVIADGAVDRALGLSRAGEADAGSLEYSVEISDSPLRAFTLAWDLEIWGGDPDTSFRGSDGGGFDVGVNIDGKNYLDVTETLKPGELFDTSFDRGRSGRNTTLIDGNIHSRRNITSPIIEVNATDGAVGNRVSLYFDTNIGSNDKGWISAVDNVRLRALAPGDADANGIVDVDDLLTLLAANKFNQGVDGVTWAQGDFNADDQFNTGDLLAMLSFLSGQFPSDPYASEAGAAVDAVADVIVNSETGEVTVNLAGHTVSAIIIDSAAEIFNGVEPNWDTTSQFPSTLPGELGNVLFTSTASGVDELGTVISTEFLGRDKEFYLQDLDLNILIASEGGALTKGNVIVVPEPSTWLLLTAGVLLVGWRQAKRSPGKQ